MSYTWRTAWVRNFGCGNVSEEMKILISFLRGQAGLYVAVKNFIQLPHLAGPTLTFICHYDER